MVFISKYIVPRGFSGITLYPFIFLRFKHLKDNKFLMNHEKIHLQQQLELLIVFFYLFYLIEWIYKWIRYKNRYAAYRNLSFEREAYENETNLEYLKKRQLFQFLKYF